MTGRYFPPRWLVHGETADGGAADQAAMVRRRLRDDIQHHGRCARRLADGSRSAAGTLSYLPGVQQQTTPWVRRLPMPTTLSSAKSTTK